MYLKQAEQTKKLIKIYNHFGRDAQIKKLREEVEEFIEALLSGNMEHATEEFADMLVVLSGISVGENIIEDLFSSTFDYKVDRTISRIDSGYYNLPKLTIFTNEDGDQIMGRRDCYTTPTEFIIKSREFLKNVCGLELIGTDEEYISEVDFHNEDNMELWIVDIVTEDIKPDVEVK